MSKNVHSSSDVGLDLGNCNESKAEIRTDEIVASQKSLHKYRRNDEVFRALSLGIATSRKMDLDDHISRTLDFAPTLKVTPDTKLDGGRCTLLILGFVIGILASQVKWLFSRYVNSFQGPPAEEKKGLAVNDIAKKDMLLAEDSPSATEEFDLEKRAFISKVSRRCVWSYIMKPRWAFSSPKSMALWK